MNRQQRVAVVVANTGLLTIAFLSRPVQAQCRLPAAQLPQPAATQTRFSPAPVFADVEHISTTIANQPADIYFPQRQDDPSIAPLPIALMLPGALVDRSHYSDFASMVARYGFVVVVPTHVRSFPKLGISGQLSEASEINTVLTFMQSENSNPRSPLSGKVDTEKLALLGHSHGGAVGLMAIANVCEFPFCLGKFTRPKQVVAGVFYGVNTYNPTKKQFSPVPNSGIPVALIEGSRDGVSTPEETRQTYDLIQTPPKALITIEGSNHFGITNLNNPLGAKPDPSQPTRKQTEGMAAITQWSGLFLRAHVLKDAEAWNYVYQTGDGLDATVSVVSQPCASDR